MSSATNEADRVLASFFAANYHPSDWIALLVKSRSGWARQVTGSLSWACSRSVTRWLEQQDRSGRDVYASVNALHAGRRSRSRNDYAAVRHVFLDIDHDTSTARRRLRRRSDVPPASFVLHTSPDRVHVLWRVRGFRVDYVERLQKQLSATAGGDPAATSVTQMMRLPGFSNQKYGHRPKVWVEYGDITRTFTPHDFPCPEEVRLQPAPAEWSMLNWGSPAKRAGDYLLHVPPAVAGHHGDLHTFQTCCRIVRGFALDDDQAFAVLAEWNARCQPPWTERELLQKIRSARRNGREPIGGLL